MTGRPGNEYFWISHQISGLLTPLTPLGVHPQSFETYMSDSFYCGITTCPPSRISDLLTALIVKLFLCLFFPHIELSALRPTGRSQIWCQIRVMHVSYPSASPKILDYPPLICTLIGKSRAPCKIYPIFSGWQKHLRFFRAWDSFFSDLPYETQLFSQVATLENLRCFCHPEKIG